MRNRCVARLAALAWIAGVGLAFVAGVYQGYRQSFPTEMLRSLSGTLLSASSLAPPPFADISGRVSVACPAEATTILVLGQSNAANYLATPVGRRDDLAAFVFWQGDCYRIEDPVLGASGQGGSLWSRLAQQLSGAQGKAVVIIAAAVAGSRAAEWAGPKGHTQDVLAIVRDAEKRGLEPDFIVWHQGEADAARNTKARDYERALGLTFDLVHASLPKARWLMMQASYCQPRSTSASEIVEAQRRVASARPFVRLVMNTDELGDRYRYDRCHFNDNAVAHIVGTLAAAIETDQQQRRREK